MQMNIFVYWSLPLFLHSPSQLYVFSVPMRRKCRNWSGAGAKREYLWWDRRWRNLWLQPISAKYLSLLLSPQLQHSELLLCMWVYFCLHLSFSEEAGLMHFRQNDWYSLPPFIVLERTVSAVSTLLLLLFFFIFFSLLRKIATFTLKVDLKFCCKALEVYQKVP